MNVPNTQHFNVESDKMMSCPCCGKGGLSIPLLILIEWLRTHYGKPVIITSGARCEKHNLKVGGSKNSEHKTTEEDPLSDAADIYVKGVSIQELYLYVKSLPFANLLGIGKYKGRLHVDTRGYAARWVG